MHVMTTRLHLPPLRIGQSALDEVSDSDNVLLGLCDPERSAFGLGAVFVNEALGPDS
jgi:hypothetical protein